MSYEFGPSGTHIYITQDGLNGQTVEHLSTLRKEILSGERPPAEIVEALDEVIANPEAGTSIVGQRREYGRYLMGVSEHMRPGDEKRVDGLMYAQGEDLRSSGAFSVVRMATWMREKRRHPVKNDQQLTDALVRHGLTNIENEDEMGSHGAWGVPVERTTRIIPLHPTDSERPDGYIYGHRKDFAAIEGLSLPSDLKLLFADVAATWHATELEGDAPAFANILRSQLSDWTLPADS